MGADSSPDGRAAPKRSHKSKGIGRGGRRPGAGRPPGSKNVLPQGCVAAIKAAGLRVPKHATEAEKELADRALVRIADVLEERVSSFGAFSVLTAARGLREEICGKVADRLEVADPADAASITDEEWATLSTLQHQVRRG